MTQPITSKLAQLKEIAEMATPGPWKRGSDYTASIMAPDGEMVTDTLCAYKRRSPTSKTTNADAEYIAAFNPATALALIEALSTAVEALNEVIRASDSGDGTSTECHMCHTAQDSLQKIEELIK